MRWSVVITTRNRAAMLRRAIRSCVEQTVPCEIVVVDDGSEDNSANVAEDFPGLRYIRHERPLGHSAAANRGVREATGDWIKPLDDDDWLAPDCIEKMTAGIEMARAKDFNPVIISGGAINVDEAGRKLGQSRSVAPFASILKSKDLLRLMLVDLAPIGTPVQAGHEREIALRVGGWNEHRIFDCQHGEEVELWIKLAAQGDCVFLPSFIANRTIWPGCSQSRISPEERYRVNLYLKELIAAELGKKAPEGVKSYLALHWALIAVKSGLWGQAAKIGVRCLKRPNSISHMFEKRTSKKAIKLTTRLD